MNMNPISCSCPDCQGMCANSTCLPTPEEARALIKAGCGDRMAGYQWAGLPEYRYLGPAPVGKGRVEGLPTTTQGACTFFKDGLCELHDKGLKPLEGRLALHDRDWRPIRMHVCNTWKGKQFESVHKLWVKETK